jgi:superfamily I DNA/RNA helicase
MSWLAPASALTPAQLRVLDQGLTRHLVVEGPAGSGKTALLLHRAAALRDGRKIDPEGMRIFTYTNVLKGYLGSSLDLLGLPQSILTTFDAWCLDLHRRHISSHLPRDCGRTDFQLLRDRVERHLALAGTARALLDAALVDEGQDLPPQAFRILARAAKHVLVNLDPSQRIFPGGSTPAQVRAALGLRPADPELRVGLGHRCGREVATFAAGFLDDPGERSRFLAQAREARLAGQQPLACFGAGQDDVDARMLELVRQRLSLGERIGLLLSRTHQVRQFAERLRQAGIPMELALPRLDPCEAEADFGNNLPKLCTFHSAKGISFDSVFLPMLDNESFPRDAGPARRRLLFVGITRAAKWVFLGRAMDRAFDEDPWLEEGGRMGTLILQRDPNPAASSKATAPDAGRFLGGQPSFF